MRSLRRGAWAAVPLGAAVLTIALALGRPGGGSDPEAGLAPENEARLPSQGENVVAMAVDLSARDGDGLDRANLSLIARADGFIRGLEGVRGYSSPLRATVVRATADDISARPFVPPDLVEAYDPTTAEELRLSHPLFPEIHPYWSADFRTVAFYLELGSRLPPAALVARLEELQRSLEPEGVAVHFTGLRPISVVTARLMTRDLRALLPFAGVLIAAVYLLTFGSARGVLLALAATASAACIGYAAFLLLPAAAGPLLVLLPVFAGGLLSDYVIHAGYHLGSYADGSSRAVRSYLALPLALTAATTVIGFLSLIGLGSGAHVFVGVTVSAGALAALALALWWVPAFGPLRALRPRVTTRHIRRVLVVVVLALARHRVVAALILAAAAGLAALNVPRLRVEPYPLHQLPEASTIVQAERLFNGRFAGTVPFAIELDAGEPNAFVRRAPLERLALVHRSLAETDEIGHHQSLLTVVERIHSYFTDGRPASRRLPDVQDPGAFERLVSQYLLFFAASASPAAYDALTDADFSVARLHGILRYRDSETLRRFQDLVETLRGELPDGWTLRVTGPVQDLLQHAARLRNGWLRTFGSGALLIFLTVLAAFRDLRLATLSLLPPCAVLLAVTGAAPLFGVHLDDYTVIAIAVTLGLTVDYTIHVINALRRSPGADRRPDADATGRLRLAIAVARGSGVPVFMSFLTSVVAFLSLAVSSFAGAVHFGMMIAAAIAGAFVLSLYVATWELPAVQGRNG
ncbi:MAG: hypothetical protein OXQ31_26140 [Spirochaetaceae bacterium]|nr:hypothetical protein [Spirochaetaceae bacterium]